MDTRADAGGFLEERRGLETFEGWRRTSLKWICV